MVAQLLGCFTADARILSSFELFCRRLQVALDAEKQTVSSLRKEIEDKHSVELQRQEKNAEKNRSLMRHETVLFGS